MLYEIDCSCHVTYTHSLRTYGRPILIGFVPVMQVSAALLQAQFLTTAPNSQHSRNDIAYSLRNCHLEVIQRLGGGVSLRVLSFKRPHKKKKNSGRLKSGEHNSQIFIELRQSPRRSLSLFVVSLEVWQVALSCCNQQSAPSKPRTVAQDLSVHSSFILWVLEFLGRTVSRIIPWIVHYLPDAGSVRTEQCGERLI